MNKIIRSSIILVFLVLTTNIITAQSKVFDNLKMESKILKMERKFAVFSDDAWNGIDGVTTCHGNCNVTPIDGWKHLYANGKLIREEG